jgi:hypothetical protein
MMSASDGGTVTGPIGTLPMRCTILCRTTGFGASSAGFTTAGFSAITTEGSVGAGAGAL